MQTFRDSFISVLGLAISRLGHLILALSSLAPLMTIMGIQLFLKSREIAIVLFVVAFSATLLLAAQLREARNNAPFSIVVNNAIPKSAEMTGYIFSYLIPFIGTEFIPTAISNTEDLLNVIAISLVLLLLCIAYSNSTLVYVNPLVSILGYKFYDIDTESGTRLLLSRRRYFTPNERIRVSRIDDFYNVIEVK